MTISVRVGSLIEDMKTSVVSTKIPLLVGVDYMSQWDLFLINESDRAFIKIDNKEVYSKMQRGHWVIPISGEIMSKKECKVSYPTNTSRNTNDEQGEEGKESEEFTKEDMKQFHIKNSHKS